jgi:hypothetical protein
VKLRGFLDFAAADAGSASADALCRAVHNGVNVLQIDIPAALGHIVCVADTVPKLRPAPANIAYFSHNNIAPQVGNFSLAA